jgi:hypothetical protein
VLDTEHIVHAHSETLECLPSNCSRGVHHRIDVIDVDVGKIGESLLAFGRLQGLEPSIWVIPLQVSAGCLGFRRCGVVRKVQEGPFRTYKFSVSLSHEPMIQLHCANPS